MMRRKVLLRAIVIAFCVGLFAAPPVHATEGGGSMYAGGNEDFMAGALPPPGFYFINYALGYNANKLMDNSGHKVRMPGGFQADVVAEAARILHVTNVKILGGNLVWHIVPSFIYQHVSAGGSTGTKYGLGDFNFGSGISWHGKTLHGIFAVDGFAPTGSYDKDDVSNTGRNYWSVMPIAGITYLGDKDSPIPGFEMSGKFMYMFNSTNNATGYTSGQEFSVDYLIGQHIGKWAFGANGYFYYQTTDDSYRNEPTTFDGYKGRKLSIGPAIQYLVGKGAITAKVQFDTWTKNKAEGTGVWLKFFYPF